MLKNVILLVLMGLFFIGCGDDEESDEMKFSIQEIIWAKDGSRMILLPASNFEMGDASSEPDILMEHSLPIHTVELDDFYIDVHEVTVGQFKKFIDDADYVPSAVVAHWKSLEKYWSEVSSISPTDLHPIVYVSWHDAMAYALWVGKRLPTEAEWEYSARGGLMNNRYPWGTEITHDNANYLGIGGRDQWDKGTAPIGSFDPNGYGIYDIAGNVWEWCLDEWEQDFYVRSPISNPVAGHTNIDEVMNNYKDIKSNRVLRGGAWISPEENLRVANRYVTYDSPKNMSRYDGFRCAADIE